MIMKARTDGGLWLALHDIRADATNANVFRESKLHVSLVTHAFLRAPVRGSSEWRALEPHIEAKTLMA